MHALSAFGGTTRKSPTNPGPLCPLPGRVFPPLPFTLTHPPLFLPLPQPQDLSRFSHFCDWLRPHLCIVGLNLHLCHASF